MVSAECQPLRTDMPANRTSCLLAGHATATATTHGGALAQLHHSPTLAAHLHYEVGAIGRGDYKEGVAQVAKHGNAAATAQRLAHLQAAMRRAAKSSKRSGQHTVILNITHVAAAEWPAAAVCNAPTAAGPTDAAASGTVTHCHSITGGGQLGGQRDAIQLVLLRQQDVAE